MGRLRNKIIVKGIVQGVGFRPTVYKYAVELGLCGTVLNSASGVFIEVEGTKKAVTEFCQTLKSAPPPLSKIESFEITEIPTRGDIEFKIIKSQGFNETKDTAISPDVVICDDCLKEIRDPKNRRYRYPFTNCTNCGPRFTIIKDRPYDRHLTSMAKFPMCPKCQTEYEDPLNRRFHAQPNSCPDCGPQLKIIKKAGEIKDTANSLMDKTINGIKDGELWTIKGLGGFNLVCDPFNEDAMDRLRKGKRRPTKSFALMARTISDIKKYCFVSVHEEKLLKSTIAPIVLLKKKNNLLDHISPDNNYLGVMLPYTPLHHILMESFTLLIMTSANLRNEPIASSDSEIEILINKNLCDGALSNDREIVHKCDDSIAMIFNNKPVILRRSRGIVPKSMKIKGGEKLPSLSLGGNLKNCFAVRRNNEVYQSQHIGDLMDLRNLDYQKTQIYDFTHLLDISISQLNIDAHPYYETSNPDFLNEFDYKNLKKIQHHHAHILSVMGENNLLGEKVLGIAIDGTGYGDDGTIWGCEFLEIGKNYNMFQRKAHLQQFLLPGGEKAVHELDRISISLAFSSNINLTSLPFTEKRIREIGFLLEKQLNSVLTSSGGRLFDGISALCGVCSKITYEGQGAILLQKRGEEEFNSILKSDSPSLTDEDIFNLSEESIFDLWLNSIDKITKRSEPYPVNIISENNILTISFKELIKSILHDLKTKVNAGIIAMKFHHWFASSILKVTKQLSPEIVCLSGGVFQNRLLLTILTNLFKRNSIKFRMNEEIPINDGGIAFGQSMI